MNTFKSTLPLVVLTLFLLFLGIPLRWTKRDAPRLRPVGRLQPRNTSLLHPSAPSGADPTPHWEGPGLVIEKVLRALRLLSMSAWVGGIAFFAFVVAPVAFNSLPTHHEAGLIVGGTLVLLHRIGLVSGVVFCLATGLLWFRAEVPARVGFFLGILLSGIMLLITAYSQFSILPRMDQDRVTAGGAIETADLDSPARVHFERLHSLSERLEGIVLLCGIGVLLVLARESQWPETGKIKTL